MLYTIKASVFNLVFDELQKLNELRNDQYSLLILGGGHQTKQFYKNLGKDHDVELLWRGWSGPKWSKIFSFIPGQAGLIRVKNIDRLHELHDAIGERSTCRLYFLPRKKSSLIIDAIRSNYWRMVDPKHNNDINESLKDYFVLETFYDISQENTAQDLYRIKIEYGEKIDQNIKNVLLKFHH